MKNRHTIPKVDYRAADQINPGIEIIELDDIYRRRPQLEHDPARPHRVNFHCLLFVKEGLGRHFIDFDSHAIGPGDCVFINRHQIHHFDLVNRPRGQFVLFTREYTDIVYSNIRMPLYTASQFAGRHAPVMRLAPAQVESVTVLLDEITKELRRPVRQPLLHQLLFSSLLLTLLRYREELPSCRLSEKQAIQFDNFLRLLEQHVAETREAADYAARLHITYKSLNALCKQAARQTAKQLIDSYVILEAKRRLAVDTPRVQGVADALGFDEATNFVKYFKRHTGMTPRQFKQQVQG